MPRTFPVAFLRSTTWFPTAERWVRLQSSLAPPWPCGDAPPNSLGKEDQAQARAQLFFCVQRKGPGIWHFSSTHLGLLDHPPPSLFRSSRGFPSAYTGGVPKALELGGDPPPEGSPLPPLIPAMEEMET